MGGRQKLRRCTAPRRPVPAAGGLLSFAAQRKPNVGPPQCLLPLRFARSLARDRQTSVSECWATGAPSLSQALQPPPKEKGKPSPEFLAAMAAVTEKQNALLKQIAPGALRCPRRATRGTALCLLLAGAGVP